MDNKQNMIEEQVFLIRITPNKEWFCPYIGNLTVKKTKSTYCHTIRTKTKRFTNTVDIENMYDENGELTLEKDTVYWLGKDYIYCRDVYKLMSFAADTLKGRVYSLRRIIETLTNQAVKERDITYQEL